MYIYSEYMHIYDEKFGNKDKEDVVALLKLKRKDFKAVLIVTEILIFNSHTSKMISQRIIKIIKIKKFTPIISVWFYVIHSKTENIHNQKIYKTIYNSCNILIFKHTWRHK